MSRAAKLKQDIVKLQAEVRRLKHDNARLQSLIPKVMPRDEDDVLDHQRRIYEAVQRGEQLTTLPHRFHSDGFMFPGGRIIFKRTSSPLEEE